MNKSDIEEKYDDLEKKMLSKFFKFVSEHDNHFWLHWNMRNIHYGFEALGHRYKVLGAKDSDFIKIPDEKRLNLSDMILREYGDNAVSHPRMQKLMELNGGEPKGFLSGENEAKAFENKEYVKLRNSALAKAGWFRAMFEKLLAKKIKTERSPIGVKLYNFCESLPVKILGVLSLICSVISVLSASVFWLRARF